MSLKNIALVLFKQRSHSDTAVLYSIRCIDKTKGSFVLIARSKMVTLHIFGTIL